MISPAAAGPLRPQRTVALATSVFALLVAATLGGLFLAQAVKRQAPTVLRPVPGWTLAFRPSGPPGGGLDREAHVDLRLSVSDVVDVYAITATGRRVGVLARNLPMHLYRHRPLAWNGRTPAGALAAPGYYSLQVRLEHAGQTLVVPGFRMRLEGPAG